MNLKILKNPFFNQNKKKKFAKHDNFEIKNDFVIENYVSNEKFRHNDIVNSVFTIPYTSGSFEDQQKTCTLVGKSPASPLNVLSLITIFVFISFCN